jgi:hypothetical protein
MILSFYGCLNAGTAGAAPATSYPRLVGQPDRQKGLTMKGAWIRPSFFSVVQGNHARLRQRTLA